MPYHPSTFQVQDMPLTVVLRCDQRLVAKARYVLDTLLMTHGVPVVYSQHIPHHQPCLVYGTAQTLRGLPDHCMAIVHDEAEWAYLQGPESALPTLSVGLACCAGAAYSNSPIRPGRDIPFDLLAHAFFFLSSWTERMQPQAQPGRCLYADSIFARRGLPQDVVDRYLQLLMCRLRALCARLGVSAWAVGTWPQAGSFALVLSHDVDFIPAGRLDMAKQGLKTVLRHLVRQRDPVDALRTVGGLMRAMARRRDPYGCIPEILAKETELGVRSSFQIAVARRHPADVNYCVENDATRDYLKAIVDAGFDLCLHGSYRSTEQTAWYVSEAELLANRLGRPLGSRQHFLSFNFENLFEAQELSGIEYDMSMGFPDRTGPRAGFSYPYFPYNLKEDRPYRVLEISLFLMDVTLRSYMGLKGQAARQEIHRSLQALKSRGGCASAVWHPIVFGGARDPGYDELFWDLINQVRALGGCATDGRSINEFWRHKARSYFSFAQDHALQAGSGSHRMVHLAGGSNHAELDT